jgi:hypothetical protein
MTVSERAKLCSAALGVVIAVLPGCRDPRQAYGVYSHGTRELVRVDYDFNADGTIDVRTYMRAGRPVRLEGDANGDGVIDRWEYYDSHGALVRIGSSTTADGREDAWILTTGDERRIELSTERDGIVDRREVYRGSELVRTESDTNHDGLPDAWEEFENGALVRVLLDDRKRGGAPTRRITYLKGTEPRVELLARDRTNAPH